MAPQAQPKTQSRARSPASTAKMVQTRRERGSFQGPTRAPVIVEGVWYGSRTAAAEALGLTPQAISIAVRERRPGFVDAPDNGQR